MPNIQLEYEMIRSGELADKARSTYSSGKEFAYDHVQLQKTVPIQKGTDTQLNIKVDAQRQSMKAILLLFTEPYVAGARDSEKYVFPNLTRIRVTINEGIVSTDLWAEASPFFVKEKRKQST